MNSYIGRVGSCCNNFNYVDGMLIKPYLAQSVYATELNPRIKPYSGWASYKNVKSGQYNRQLCWPCNNFKGFPQTPGVFDLNIVNSPPALPDFAAQRAADEQYQIYQAERMRNHPGKYGTGYVNYLNHQCGSVYPKRYVKGNWPDEQLVVTNTPVNGCHTVPDGVNVCSSYP